MLRTSLLAAALTLATVTAGQAGTLSPGSEPWRTSDCFKPNPPGKDSSEAQTLNLTVSSFDEYLDKINEYYACISAEVARDQERVRQGAEQALQRAHQEALDARPFK